MIEIQQYRTDFINSWLSDVPENILDIDGQLLFAIRVNLYKYIL